MTAPLPLGSAPRRPASSGLSATAGSVRLITGGTGAVTGASEFDTYGNRTDHTGLTDSAIGFTGNWTDPTTGLIYLRARDYDPTTASFLTVDPLLDQTRMPYAYAKNNPLQFTDPSGLDSLAPSDWQYWVIASSPLFSAIHNVSSRVESGTDLWSALVMTLDPAYAAIEGYSNYADHTQAGCPWYVRAGDLVEGIGGLVGTVGVATGATAGISAGVAAVPEASSVSAIADSAGSRVSLRVGTKADIRANAEKTAEGDFIDPNTGAVIPQDGPLDYGHKPGYEWWRTQKTAREDGWSRQDLIEYENDPNHYQIEDPSSNRSRRFEQIG